MSLGPLMVDIAGTELSSEDLDILRNPLVGSVILFARNYRDPRQISALCGAIREVRNPPLLIAVDHEGGRVQRFRDGFTRLPPVRVLGRRYDEDRRDALGKAHLLGWLMAAELRAVGVDFSFAPCVDLDYGLSDIIGGISGLLGGKKSGSNAGGIPLLITGTTSSPSFRLDTSQMGLGKPGGAVKGTGSKLKGLFGR